MVLQRLLGMIVAMFIVCVLTVHAGGDKDVNAKLVKVDAKAKVLVVKTDGGEKKYDVNDDTKFIGPKGGVSDKGLKDDRLVPGAELKLKVAANNRTLHEVHLPERKGK
jgi:hypothetical protein